MPHVPASSRSHFPPPSCHHSSQSPTLPRSTMTTGISILFLEKVVSGPSMGPLRLARAHTTIEARLLMESTFPPRRYSSIRSASCDLEPVVTMPASANCSMSSSTLKLATMSAAASIRFCSASIWATSGRGRA